MSLKYFHIIFAIAVTLLCFGVAAFILIGGSGGDSTLFGVGVFSLVAGVGSFIYIFYAWKKLSQLHIE